MAIVLDLPSGFDGFWKSAQAYTLGGAYPTTVVFGLPAYFMLRRHLSAKLLGCVIVGSMIAAFPWALLVMLGSGADQAGINGRATVISGQTTAYGWLKNAEFIVTIGLFGAIGSFVFWAVAAAGHKTKARRDDQ